MRCPKCESTTNVINSRVIEDGRVARMRRCKQCRYLFYTAEAAVNEDMALMISQAQYTRKKKLMIEREANGRS